MDSTFIRPFDVAMRDHRAYFLPRAQDLIKTVYRMRREGPELTSHDLLMYGNCLVRDSVTKMFNREAVGLSDKQFVIKKLLERAEDELNAAGLSSDSDRSWKKAGLHTGLAGRDMFIYTPIPELSEEGKRHAGLPKFGFSFNPERRDSPSLSL